MTVGWSLHGVLIYLSLITCSKLNGLSGIDIPTCGNSFLCNFDGKTRRVMEVNAPLPPLAMSLIRDPGTYISYIGS